jgi:hypothetical protein
MQFDFSELNLAYLIQARDLVIAHPGRAGTMLGISDPMVALLPDLTPQLLAAIAGIHQPLIFPHQDIGWWSRLLRALEDRQRAEIATLLDRAAITLVAETEGRQ